VTHSDKNMNDMGVNERRSNLQLLRVTKHHIKSSRAFT